MSKQEIEFPKITVIVPVYNTEDLVERCVRSILHQTYPKEALEVIAVDDGSTDATPQILRKLAETDPNLHVIRQENAGTSAARNTGIKAATGDFIGFVDADDYLEEDMYEELMGAIRRSGARMAQAGRDERAQDGSALPPVTQVPEKEEIVSSKEFLSSLLLHEGDASFCTKLTRRSLFDDGHLFPEGELNEDFSLMVRMLDELPFLVRIPKRCYHVCYRSGSNSRTDGRDPLQFPSVFEDIVRNALWVQKRLEGKDRELEQKAKRFALVQHLDYLMHIPVPLMTGENLFYRQTAAYLRSHLGQILTNPYLSTKQRLYLGILSLCPRTARAVHAWSMALRGKNRNRPQ